MQFHHHGYVSGDPRIATPAGVGADRSGELADTLDVLIVGAGPAGMIAAAQLSQFPDIHAAIVEKRPHRLEVGQADGIQSRSVETFQAFGFAEEMIAEAQRIVETTFWKQDPAQPENIIRTARTPDDPRDISEFPHLIVNQARVLDYFAEFAARGPARMGVHYGVEFCGLEIGEGDHPVTVHLKDDQGERTVRAKYVIGADGARSGVRKAIGAQHEGGVSNHAWGVLDVLADTDFPDVRFKVAVSAASGSLLMIPREGGFLFRLYVDLGEVAADDNRAVRNTPREAIIGKAQAALHPYRLDIKDVAWWSVYEVGHRVTDRFDDVPADEVGTRTPRVFIAGDACHTHSAKAGQGMNMSMQDGFNIAWKIAQVLRGQSPAALLQTYTVERREIAQKLVAYDREWSSLMVSKPSADNPRALEEYYEQHAEFPAGFMTHYQPSLLTGDGTHQDTATGFPLGKRFKSAPVIRVSDANPVHLGHLHAADGRWRIYVFADEAPAGSDSAVARLATWLTEDAASPLVAHRAEGSDLDATFDVKVVYQQPYTEVALEHVPAVFKPKVGPFQVPDLNKVFAVDPDADIWEARGIDRAGAIVVVRPDQYVATVLPLDAHAELADFLRPIFTP
ncbi:MAG: FAD-dependent monooxygenase [Propionibacteriaceae bacterium]|nr:FAD-dependent monooxygenase [Propionibacteriaceae bacterium]